MTSPTSSLSDPVFGTLVYEDELGSFVGSADWFGQSVRISFGIDNIEPAQGLAAAHSVWRDQDALGTRLRNEMATEVLSLKNENWLDDGEAALTGPELIARLLLESVNFYIDEDGVSFEFLYDDDGLFGGHAVIIGGDTDEEDLDVSLFG